MKLSYGNYHEVKNVTLEPASVHNLHSDLRIAHELMRTFPEVDQYLPQNEKDLPFQLDRVASYALRRAIYERYGDAHPGASMNVLWKIAQFDLNLLRIG